MIFRNWVLQNFPFLEDDFDALTDYELFCKMVEYMKKSLEKIKDYQKELNLFSAKLDDFQHYFDNLDVQEEINNKLDEMAESGELTDIIAQYLQLAGVLAYNTIEDMSEADNLVNGSICYCLGDDEYNDGKGGFYKIRTVTVDDTIDGFNIVELDVSNTLIAERMPNYYINEIKTVTDSLKTPNEYDIPTIMIGDSYACGESNGTTVVGWCERLKNLLNLSDNNFHKIALSGYGFVTDPNFLDGFRANDGSIDKESIKSIIVCGGYNDARLWTNEADLKTKIKAFVTYCHQYYPNAKVYLGMVGNSSDRTSYGVNIRKLLNNIILTLYQIGSDDNDGNTIYLNGVENILKYNNLISADTIHPTEFGYQNMALWIYKAYTSGYCETFSDYETMTAVSAEANPTTEILQTIKVAIHNETVTILSSTQIEVTFQNLQEFDGTDKLLFNYASNHMLPNIPLCIPVKFISSDENATGTGAKYYGNIGMLKFTENAVLLDTQMLNDSHTAWTSGNLTKKIQIKPFTFDTSIRNV